MLSIVILSAAIGTTAQQAAPATPPVVQVAAAEKPKEKLICRRAPNIGSNIPTKKMCYTKAQWDAASRDSQAMKRSMEQAWSTPNQ